MHPQLNHTSPPKRQVLQMKLSAREATEQTGYTES